MGFFDLARIPEPEVMDDSGEVEAYASAAAQSHLEKIDDTFVEHALRLIGRRENGRALDIGTGPGQIVIKLARLLPHWRFSGVDFSSAMIARAAANLSSETPALLSRVEFRIADGNRLDFPDGAFDLVLCNSVLHHLAEPRNLLAEISRVVKPAGAVLLRDLRRPGRFAYPLHIRQYGRHYSGTMHKLYRDSVRAAYTARELQGLLDASPLQGAKVFMHGPTHIGIERASTSPILPSVADARIS